MGYQHNRSTFTDLRLLKQPLKCTSASVKTHVIADLTSLLLITARIWRGRVYGARYWPIRTTICRQLIAEVVLDIIKVLGRHHSDCQVSEECKKCDHCLCASLVHHRCLYPKSGRCPLSKFLWRVCSVKVKEWKFMLENSSRNTCLHPRTHMCMC